MLKPNILRIYGSKNKQRAMLSMPEGRETLVLIRGLVPIQNEMVTVNVVNKAIHLRGNSLPDVCPINSGGKTGIFNGSLHLESVIKSNIFAFI